MNEIQVNDDDFQIIQALKEHADISTDEEVIVLFCEIFLVLLIEPEKASVAVDLLKQPKYDKIREVMKAVWSIGEPTSPKSDFFA